MTPSTQMPAALARRTRHRLTRLAVDCRMHHSSGIGTYLCALLQNLALQRPDLELYLLGNPAALRSLPHPRPERVAYIDCGAPIYSLREQWELMRRIPRCDLFFSPHYNVPFLSGERLVTTVHDVCHLAVENPQWTRLKSLYARTMLTAALRKSRRVLTVSRFTLAEMQKYRLPCLDKVRVVYNGVDQPESIARDLPRPEPGRYVLFVGNVKPHKNVTRLIEAYQLLRRQEKISIPLKIIGQTEGFRTGSANLKREVETSPWRRWIEFTGPVNAAALARAYAEAALLVAPSLYEGFGLTPLEAMAHGCPCVVSHAASFPEVCGDAVLYCDPYSADDIADKIHSLLINPELRNRLRDLGHERIRRFNWRNTARAVLEVLDEAAGT